MNIKKKIGMAMATTALGATLIAGASFALFTDSAANNNNTFTAGTVNITDYTGGDIFSESDLFFANLAPGDSGEASLTIKNEGTLDAWVRIDPQHSVLSGALFQGSNPLVLGLSSANPVLVPAGQSVTFTGSYSFPSAADNSYQGATGSVDVAVQAIQARNNTKSDGTGPTSW